MSPCPAIVRAMLALLLCVGLLGPLDGARAFASPPGAAPSERQARDLFQKAEMSFNLGRFADALTDYQGAYQAKPLPAFLFNIAQCYRNLQNFERARFFYRRYLALDPRTANRRLVEDLIAEMTRAIDHAGEGRAVAPASAPTAVNLAPSDPSSSSAATSSASASLVGVQASAAPPPPTARPVYKRWWFWAGVGGVAAGAVIAGIVATRPDAPQGSLGTIDGR